MISRAALLFFALIWAIALFIGASNGAQVDLEPLVPICGHISALSADSFAFSVEPNTPSISLLLRWRGAESDLGMVLRSPSGKEIDTKTYGGLVTGNASSSFVLLAPEAGKWSVEISSGRLPSGSDDYCISFKPGRIKEQMVEKARFNGLYRDFGVDENGNGLYEYMVLVAGINVRAAGNYYISGYLYDMKSQRKIAVEGSGRLNIGSQSLELELGEMAAPGPYRLSNLTLYDENWDVVDKSSPEYMTHEYKDFEMASARLTGNYSDYGSDLNGDGFFDYLTIDVGVEVFAPENYSLMGYLCDSEGRDLVWSLGFGYLLPGIHTMHIDFDGKSLWQSRVNGPYTLCDLALSSGDSIQENLSNEDAANSPYITKPYNYTQFVDPVWPKGTISGSGDGEILLTISIERSLPVFQGRYSLDIVGVTMPPISSNWTMSGYEGGYVYDLPGVHMPGTPNNFTVTAAGAKNLNVGVRREFAGVGVNFTRAWVTAQAQAVDDDRAMVESDLISPGKYQFKIFGDAADNAKNVTLKLEVVKRLVINGDFNLSINADGLPSGDYSISAKALNGSLRLDRLELKSPDIKF